MRISNLNEMTRAQFTTALGCIFEDSPWVADQAWRLRPFGSVAALHDAMCAQVREAPLEDQLALLRAHPDLGTRARMSAASVEEQNQAGLSQLTPSEYGELTGLTAAYRDTFGFPFLYAVKGATKGAIMDSLRSRLESSPHAEFTEALAQVYRIAGFRLRDLLAEQDGQG
jgi:OHCU decarboxylase